MVNYNAIVSIIEKITMINGAPCKKSLQKIVFLIEAKNVGLGCDYSIHFYGPYSADLDYAVRKLCDAGVLTIDYTPRDHLVSVVDKSMVDDYLDSTVDQIIENFARETPGELELLATALYVYLGLKDKGRIKAGVKKLKGTKYSDSRIDSAITKLENYGYIAA